MIKSVIRLSLGLFLILAASAVLLLTDRGNSRNATTTRASTGGGASTTKVRTVALFQHVSQPTIEEGAKGAIAGLASLGYDEAGGTLRLKRFNAEGDAATSNTIARELVGGEFDLIVTLSTPSLQAVANANRDQKVPHVFGMVSDPVAAGIGIARDDPMKHPSNTVGLGTMQPVAEAFRMARRLSPGLKRVGVAWNPSEANSEAGTKIARVVCKELGIELLEANVDGAPAVREAVASVLGRGAEAIWVGGDVTVLAALDAVIGPSRAQGVPVFSNIPGSAARGTLFDLGADYYQVGGKVGQLAGKVLDGDSPAKMPILYEVPPEFWINNVALNEVKGGWSFPDDVKAKADVVVGAKGPERARPRAEFKREGRNTTRPSKTWKIGVVAYSESTLIEEVWGGLRAGMKETGLVDGRDYVLDSRNAQGDIATLNAIFDELDGNDSDLVVSMSTPGLQAALRKVDSKPLIFSVVLDPFKAGAGKSETDHRPNMTGTYLAFPYSEMIASLREIFPKVVKVGTLYTPGEVNSVEARERFERLLKQEGIELVSLPINGATEASDAAAALCQSGIDVFCQVSDNLSNSCFPAIARACEAAKMPLVSFATAQVTRGAVFAVGADYAENGRQAAILIAEVIRGADPTRIPFRPSSKVRRAVNLDVARRLGIVVPPGWLKKADVVLPAGNATPTP